MPAEKYTCSCGKCHNVPAVNVTDSNPLYLSCNIYRRSNLAFSNIHRRRRCLFVIGTLIAPAVNVTQMISSHGVYALPVERGGTYLWTYFIFC